MRGGIGTKKMEQMNLIRNLIRNMVDENYALTLKGMKKQLEKKGISKQLSTCQYTLKISTTPGRKFGTFQLKEIQKKKSFIGKTIAE